MRVEREVELPATPGEVWAALVDEGRLAEWLGADAGARLEIDLDVEPGATGIVAEPGAATRRVLVEVVEPERRVRFQWWPEDGSGPLSEVDLELTETADATTRLRVTETLVAPAPPPTPPAPPGPPRRLGFELRSRVLVGA